MSAPHSDDVPRNRLAATMADLDGLDLDAPTWAEVTGKPTSFPPSAHKHTAPADFTATGTPSATAYLRGDNTWAVPPNTNTTYAVPTQAEIEAGTATTARAISAAGLKGAIQRWATGTYSTAISAIGQALNKAATAAEARTAIGAGTSNLAIGTTASTAKAGNWVPTKADVGLGNVDNTSDTNKPISTAVSQALGTKAASNHTHTPASIGAEPAQWYGTQAQYDSIGTKDPNRTYNILEG